MDYDEVLNELLGFIGKRVGVSVAAANGDPVLILDAVGTLERGTEVVELGRDDETYLFVLDQHASFFFDRPSFAGARWEGNVLVIGVGPTLVRVSEET